MDEDIDKTGYSKLKTEALCKAFKYCTRVTEITIGPDACTKQEENTVNTESPFSTSIPKKKCNSSFETSTRDIGVSVEMDKEEERYCAKKLLAELNKLCDLDGQKMKFSIIKKRLKKLERAKQEADHMVALEEAEARLRRQEVEDQMDSIQNQLILKQQLLANSTFVPRDISKKTVNEIKNEKEEHQRLKDEKSSEIKRLYDSIYKNEVEFKNAYREIVDIIKNFKENKQAIALDVDIASKINGKFISLIDHCKASEITPTDVAVSSSLLKDILAINWKIKDEKAKYDSEIQERKQNEEIKEKSLAEQQMKEKENEKPMELDTKHETRKVSTFDYMENYNSLSKYLLETELNLKPFIADEAFKKYRSDCQKAVNLPVNAISPCSAAHLNDKLKKLSLLLQGQYVTVADKRVSASAHPLGITYCTNHLAEKIVRQGEQVVSSKPDAAFAIAAVTVALWMEFPNFGKLLLAHFYRRCPYLIPAYWEREENQTDEEYYKKLGFTYSDGEREDLNMFLKRQSGIVRLFSSIMITDKKLSLQSQSHPFGLAEGWKLLVAFTKLDPKAEISATVLFDILEVVGDAMVKAYGIQFHKLLHVICKSYLPKIVETTAEGMNGGPLSRLRNFLESIAKGKILQPPKGLLSSNFW